MNNKNGKVRAYFLKTNYNYVMSGLIFYGAALYSMFEGVFGVYTLNSYIYGVITMICFYLFYRCFDLADNDKRKEYFYINIDELDGIEKYLIDGENNE